MGKDDLNVISRKLNDYNISDVLRSPELKASLSDNMQLIYDVIDTDKAAEKKIKNKVYRSHEKSDELYIVIRGCLEVKVRDINYIVDDMSMLFIPKKVPHKIVRFKRTPAQIIVINAPSTTEQIVVEK